MIEPDIVKELREEEKQGFLSNKEIHLNKESKLNSEKFKDIKLILELQNGVIEDFLLKIKEGKIKTNQYVVLSLIELQNYYKSDLWKILSDKISIDNQILSFIHLINMYIEHLEQSLESEEPSVIGDNNYNEIIKLKNMVLTLNNVKR